MYSTLLGIALAMAGVVAIGRLSQRIWPPPEGLSAASDRETLRQAVASMPVAALLTVAFAWIAGAFIGGLIAARLSRSGVPAYVVGGFVAFAAVSSMLAIPYPYWFWIVALVLVPAAAIAAGRIGSSSTRSDGSGRTAAP